MGTSKNSFSALYFSDILARVRFLMKNIRHKVIQYIPIIICMALAAFFVYFPITDSDIFWHLAAGREMVAQKHVLYTDPFAFTLASPRWIDLHWLFQLLMYGIYSLGGFTAIIGFKLLIVACIAAILCLTHRSARYLVVTAFLTAILLYAVRYLIDVRPILITLLFMALYVALFERAETIKRKWPLWWCVPLQILWTNSQGLYMIGLFIIGAYWAEALWRFIIRKGDRPIMETALLALCAASCLLNPYGISGLLLPFNLFSRINPVVTNIYSLNISENVPLFALTGFEAGYRTAVIITAIIAIALFVCNRKRLQPAHLMLFVGFAYLAFSAVRNVLLYVVIVIPIIGYYTANIDLRKLIAPLPSGYRSGLTAAVCVLAFGALVLPCVRHAAVVATFPPCHALSPFRFPEKCVGYLERNPIPGRMFNDIRYGGYLIWHCYPEKQVFIDTRLVIRSPTFFAEYLALSDHPELFSKVAEKFGITQAILPSALFSRHAKLIQWLYQSDQWRLVFTDGASVFFVRTESAPGWAPIDLSNEATVQSVIKGIDAEWRDAAAVRREAYGHFRDLLNSLGLHASAQMVEEKIRGT
jgi:hypothetical protein